MIVVGYQGIGKSTLGGRNHKYIDLERKRLTIPLVLADGQEPLNIEFIQTSNKKS